MTPPCVVAGLVAAAHSRQGREIAAGGWTELVYGAGYRVTYVSAQGHAA
jgi:hypothetical protein